MVVVPTVMRLPKSLKWSKMMSLRFTKTKKGSERLYLSGMLTKFLNIFAFTDYGHTERVFFFVFIKNRKLLDFWANFFIAIFGKIMGFEFWDARL